mgnify:CR=1 FL=1
MTAAGAAGESEWIDLVTAVAAAEISLETVVAFRDEGVKAHPYTDSVGILTIGVGRNLEDVGLRQDEIDYLLTNDIRVAMLDCKRLCDDFDALSDNRPRALINMAFNPGRSRLAGFRNMSAAIERGDFAEAASPELDSKWARPGGRRANRPAYLLRKR